MAQNTNDALSSLFFSFVFLSTSYYCISPFSLCLVHIFQAIFALLTQISFPWLVHRIKTYPKPLAVLFTLLIDCYWSKITQLLIICQLQS